MARLRPRLVEFTAQMLQGAVRRSDQRDTGELYVRGLLTDGARKSMQPMAQRLGVDHQRLQQFVTSSTWDYERVRANIGRWAAEVIDPDAYVVDDSGFPKDGTASPCVARQYSGTLGKTGNCQIGVSVQMVTDTASVAANWRLFCPASWDESAISDPTRARAVHDKRARAGIPDDVRHREKWRLALDMIDQMLDTWQLPARPVVADSGYGDCTLFRLGLTERGLAYVVEVDPHRHRPAGRRDTRHRHLHRPRPATQAGLPRPARHVERPRPTRRTQRGTAGHLAPRHPYHPRQPAGQDARTLPGPPHPSSQPGHPP